MPVIGGPSFSIDNTDKYAYVLPDSLNLGWTEDGEDYAALTADNLPLGNVYGFSENLLNKMDIIEGESNVSVLKEKTLEWQQCNFSKPL